MCLWGVFGLFEVIIPPARPEEDLQLFAYAFFHDLKVSLRPILGLGHHLREHVLCRPFQKFLPGSGVGLGLTLVRRALASIQGQFSCSSRCGEGSDFQVSLEVA